MAGTHSRGHGVGMDVSIEDHGIATSAHQLQRAAGRFQQSADGPAAVVALPVAVAHLEEALERLSTAVIKSAQAVEDSDSGTGPSARALRWHLYHLAARLRGARDACPNARSWARELLRESTPAADRDAA
jgi:hypothetical protein